MGIDRIFCFAKLIKDERLKNLLSEGIRTFLLAGAWKTESRQLSVVSYKLLVVSCINYGS